MKIAFSPYRLERLVPKGHRHGALLRITYSDGCVGHADCHPWKEMADEPLERQLALLAKGITTPLTTRAMALARLDAEARDRKQTLVKPHKVPNSHWLTSDLLSWTHEDSKRLVKQGYCHLKFKVGRDVEREIPLMKTLFPYEELKLRLDFNESLTKEGFERYLDMIAPLLNHIDFIEDPFALDFEGWENIQKTYGVNLACDRQAPMAIGYPRAAKVVILKPALHDPAQFKALSRQRVVITSYVAHPLDQIASAYIAAGIDPLKAELHGLNSHHLYAVMPYSDNLSWHGPAFSAPQDGYGLGFDALLAKEPWINL